MTNCQNQKLLPNEPQNFQPMLHKTGAFWEFFLLLVYLKIKDSDDPVWSIHFANCCCILLNRNSDFTFEVFNC